MQIGINLCILNDCSDLCGVVGRAVVLGHGRAVELVLLRGIAAPELDAVGPGRPGLRHHHAEERLVGYAVGRPVLDALGRHYVLAVADGDLPLALARVVRLPHALLVPAPASAAALVPRPVGLFWRRRCDRLDKQGWLGCAAGSRLSCKLEARGAAGRELTTGRRRCHCRADCSRELDYSSALRSLSVSSKEAAARLNSGAACASSVYSTFGHSSNRLSCCTSFLSIRYNVGV